MPLPDVIEIHPVTATVRASITVPGSKSITNRALVLAALARGQTQVRHALWSEDTQAMVDCLRCLGFAVEIQPDETEPSNRHITVQGLDGLIPNAGTKERPIELFVGNAGTAARFLMALVCLGRGAYRLSGVPRMHERPQAALVQSLRQLGYQIETGNGKLPAIIYGEGPRPGECDVSIEESSQFASALLLAGEKGRWQIKVTGENSEESPYVSMTSELIEMFPKGGMPFEIEPDASSASYIWGANWLLRRLSGTPHSEISVNGWMKHSLQIDARFPDLISRFPRDISRRDELGDSIMTAIVLAPFAGAAKRFTDLGRLRLQECERVHALKNELRKCGGQVEESGDTLTISSGDLHGAEIETYDDHRMAMCFATLALKVPGIKIQNPACVKKTFPNFFQKLAAPPPDGLGAKITNARTDAPLKIPELHAD